MRKGVSTCVFGGGCSKQKQRQCKDVRVGASWAYTDVERRQKSRPGPLAMVITVST